MTLNILKKKRATHNNNSSIDQIGCRTVSAETQVNAQFCKGFSFCQEQKNILNNFPSQLLASPNYQQFTINRFKFHHIDFHKQNYLMSQIY